MNLSHPWERRTKIPPFCQIAERAHHQIRTAPRAGKTLRSRQRGVSKTRERERVGHYARARGTNKHCPLGAALPGGLEAAGAGGEDVASEGGIDEVGDAALGPQLSVILVARVGGAVGEQLGQVRVGGDRTGGGGGGGRQRQQQQQSGGAHGAQ
jgi:hypothetical protein